VRTAIERHAVETDSPVAASLLADWDVSAERFVKVMPKDYKRVLSAASQAEREGRDIDEAVMAAAHG
jgi:glutamate synthase (NADPH/NADH) large chain